MDNSLLNFFIPNNISADMALRFSNILVGDLQTVIGDQSAEVYLSIALLNTSWNQQDQTTIRGFLKNLETLNQNTSVMELAEKIVDKRDIFRDPVTGSLSINMLEIQGLVFQSLTFLNSSKVPFHMIQRLTIDKLKTLCSMSEQDVQPFLQGLNTIKHFSNLMKNNANMSDEDIIKIIQQAAKNTNQSLILLDPTQLEQTQQLFLRADAVDDDLDVLVDDDSKEDHIRVNELNQETETKHTSQPLKTVGIDVYNKDDALKFVQKIAKMPAQEGNALQKQIAMDLVHNSSFKPFSEIPMNYTDSLKSLYERFPHFSQVIDFISERLALSSCGSSGKPIRIAPMLLRGSPGTGKTYFAQELAKYLNLHFIEKDLSITSEAFVIAGMDSGWKNSKPGIVFNTIVQGPTANPLICLNEIDKCSSGDSRNSPLTTLHWLLEPTSSNKFQDEFIPLDIRADNIIWIATANDGHIPDPILSRLEVFDIQKPTQEQCKAIAQSVWQSLCQYEFPLGHGFESTLSEEILDKISAISPRIIRKTLTHMAAKAVMNHRKSLFPQDLISSMTRYQDNSKSSIGFIT